MTLPNDICRCTATKCKISNRCARHVKPGEPIFNEDDPVGWVPHADLSSSGLPCPHFIKKGGDE